MAEDDPRIAKLTLWDGTKWTLRDWRQVNRWLGEFEELWRPFETASIPADPLNVRGHLFGRLNEVRAKIANATAAGQTPADIAPYLEGQINQAYGPAHPDSETGQAVADIRDEHGFEAALFAFAVLRGVAQPAHAQNANHLRGMMAAAYPGLTTIVSGQKRLADERANLKAAVRRLSDEMDLAEEARRAHWESLLRDTGEGMVGWARRRTRGWRAALRRWRTQKDSALASIEATEKAYKEFMALRAPVDYWNDKAAKHATAEVQAAKHVRWFFMAAIPLMVVMFGTTGWYLINEVEGTPPAGLYIVVSAGLATTAGLLLWIGRLLTKLYLSQHHLRQDAEERAVMTTTYLALTAEQAAAESDRAIILHALFRATSDGIVKEDGGLDPNVASLISRLGTR